MSERPGLDPEEEAIFANLAYMPELEEAVKSGDYRRQLLAVRDYLAHELAGHRCKTCQMSQLRTGDTAALTLRLTTVMKDIKDLPEEADEDDSVVEIRNRRGR